MMQTAALRGNLQEFDMTRKAFFASHGALQVEICIQGSYDRLHRYVYVHI
jgi:hypothetical protein